MADYNSGGGSSTPDKTKDSLALLVQDHFSLAKEYRAGSGDEETWREAYDAHRAIHPVKVSGVLSLARREGSSYI